MNEATADGADNARWRQRVTAGARANPRPKPRYDMVVLGGGTAGLVTAVGSASVGARVALIEKHALGGDCLNYGCVPSKALLHEAFTHAPAGKFEKAGFERALERVRRLRADLAAHDSVERLQSLGVDVFFGAAKFTGRDSVLAGEYNLRFARACIATGTRPYVPPIEGMAEADFHTNETVFEISELPRRMVVVGGGPVGCELAQAFARFGCKVTLVHRGARLLPREEPLASSAILRALADDGVDTMLLAEVTGATRHRLARVYTVKRESCLEEVEADALLIAAGRTPNTAGLNLHQAGVKTTSRGIAVNDRLQTYNPDIFAAGDVCSPYKFTHAADAMARVVVRNALFGFVPFRPRVSRLVIPWCTYTRPQVASVGVRSADCDVVEVAMKGVDRAVLDDDTRGFLRLYLHQGTKRIVGATLVANNAGEIIGQITTAITHHIGLDRLGEVVQPYPTVAECVRKAADAHRRRALTPRTRWLLEKVIRWRL